MYYIYEIFNDVTQRKYIGLTQYPQKRFEQHLKLLRCKKHTAENIISDCVKYGIDHFSFRIIDVAENKREGLNKENRYILSNKSYSPEFGYNGKDGRFRKPTPFPKCPDNDITRKIKKQGYCIHDFPFWLSITYREFVVKLNNPKMFTKEELSILNKMLEVNSHQFWRQSLKEHYQEIKRKR